MADIRMVRAHRMGFGQARRLAQRWAEVAAAKADMHCSYEAGEAMDVVRFRRPGAHGELRVVEDRLELDVHLGFLLAMFRGRIESELAKNVDQLLAQDDVLAAFEQGLARHEARRRARLS